MARCVARVLGGFVLSSACACSSAGDQVASSSAGVTPPLPIAWTRPSWFIDPANGAGTASDKNTCTTAASPCLSFGGVVQIWGGTTSPRLRQNTTITFLSSQWNSADPVVFTPRIENGATVTLQGALGPAQQIAAGNLTVIAAKQRASAQLLDVALPAGAAPGLLVVDTTRGSRAWVYVPDSSSQGWLLSQSLVAANLPTLLPAEDDAWQTGDSVVVYQPVTVNLDEVAPTVADGATASGSPNVNIYQLRLVDPTIGEAPEEQYAQSLSVGAGVNFVESSIGKVITNPGGTTGLTEGFVNVDFGEIFLGATPGPAFTIWGGQSRYGFLVMQGGLVDGDFIVGPSFPNNPSSFGIYSMTIGDAYLGPDSAFTVWADSQVGRAGDPGIVWGAGEVLVAGSATLTYSDEATATATFLQTGGLYLDAPGLGVLLDGDAGPTTACAVDRTGSSGWTCGITVTPANLDLPVSQGGFGGNAVIPGGGSITNGGGF